MVSFFRKIRQSLFTEGNFRKYLLYAIGEIVLVVIGILIALQINNWNTSNKTKARELVYLESIKQDLRLNLESLEEFINTRGETVKSVDHVLEYFEGTIPLDLNDFNYHNLTVLVWFPFIQHANTYNELVNSGNFAIISNKEVKTELQNMQTSYENIAFIENEMQQDYERYLYHEYFNNADLNSSFNNYTQQVEGMKGESEIQLNESETQFLLNSKLYKNGLVLAVYNSNLLIDEYKNMIDRTTHLIELIDIETSGAN